MYSTSPLDKKEKLKGSSMVKVVNFILHKVFRRKKQGSLNSPLSGEGSYVSYSEIDLERFGYEMRRTQEMLGRPLTPPLKPPRHILHGADEFWTPASSPRCDLRRPQVSKRVQTKDAAVEACEYDIDQCLDHDDKYSITYGSVELEVTPPRKIRRSTNKPKLLSSKKAPHAPMDNVLAEGRTQCPTCAQFAYPWKPSPEITTNGNEFLKRDNFTEGEFPEGYLRSEATSSRISLRKGFQRRRASMDDVVTTTPRKVHDSTRDSPSRTPATCPSTGRASTSRSGRRFLKVEHRPPTPYSTPYSEATSSQEYTGPSKLYRTSGQTSLVQGRHKSPKDRGDGSSASLKTSPFSRFRHSSYSGLMMASGDESVLSSVRLRRAKDL